MDLVDLLAISRIEPFIPVFPELLPDVIRDAETSFAGVRSENEIRVQRRIIAAKHLPSGTGSDAGRQQVLPQDGIEQGRFPAAGDPDDGDPRLGASDPVAQIFQPLA